MSEQLMNLLQHMDSYISYRDPEGKCGSCWLKKVKINPVRQLWMMQVLSLAPLDQGQTEALSRSLCESYEQREILLEVLQPRTLQEAAACWPLWVESLEDEFHPADPQVGEMEALMSARIHHKGDSLVISVGEMTHIRHHEQLGALLARRLSGVFGRPIQVMFDMPLVQPKAQAEKAAQPEKPAPARIFMHGQPTFKFAVKAVPYCIDQVLEKAVMAIEDVDFFVFHQANARIIDLAAKKYHIPPEKYYKNIQKYGNTSAASIPLVISELHDLGKVGPRSRVLVVGFGGGLTWGGALVEFA